MRYVATIDGQELTVDVDRDGRVFVGDSALDVDLECIDGESLFSLIVNGVSHEVHAERRERRYFVTIAGDRYEVHVEDARLKEVRELGGARREEAGEQKIAAPMPGLVVGVIVEVGQRLSAGDGVVILEAMKMENEIRAAGAGIVEYIRVTAGQTVNQGDILVELGPPSDD